MTPFSTVYVFESADSEAIWRAYYDAGFNAQLDDELGFTARDVLHREEKDGVVRCSTRITPRRNLPRFIRRLGVEQLSYVEHSIFRQAEDRLELAVEPNLFGDRTRVTASYTVEPTGDGRFQRTFAGEVDVRVPMVGSKIEATIVDDIVRSYAVHSELTEAWINGTVAPRSAKAQG